MSSVTLAVSPVRTSCFALSAVCVAVETGKSHNSEYCVRFALAVVDTIILSVTTGDEFLVYQVGKVGIISSYVSKF